MTSDTCLTGKVVLDLGQLHPGPHAAMLLRQLGATVIKVERPGSGDSLRSLNAASFAKYNSGKLSIALDLKSAADAALFRQLVSRADAVIEGFRPGVMARLGFGYGVLKSIRPPLVLCSISGFGQTGPYAERAGHDLNYLALAGYWAVPSQVDDVVGRPRVRLSDYCGSLHAALALVVAMMTAERTGEGQHLDVSLHGATLAWTLPGVEQMLHGHGADKAHLDHVMPDNDLFPTRDGRHLALGILEEKFWANLRAVLAPEFPDLASPDYDSRPKRLARKQPLNRMLKKIFETRSLDEWCNIFAGADIPWAPVLSHDELMDDPHVRHELQRRDPSQNSGHPFPVRFSGGLPNHSDYVPDLDADRDAIMDWLKD